MILSKPETRNPKLASPRLTWRRLDSARFEFLIANAAWNNTVAGDESAVELACQPGRFGSVWSCRRSAVELRARIKLTKITIPPVASKRHALLAPHRDSAAALGWPLALYHFRPANASASIMQQLVAADADALATGQDITRRGPAKWSSRITPSLRNAPGYSQHGKPNEAHGWQITAQAKLASLMNPYRLGGRAGAPGNR